MKQRPNRIVVNWFDPLTGEWLSGADYVYSPIRSLKGFYRKAANALRKIAKEETGYRDPVLKVQMIGRKR